MNLENLYQEIILDHYRSPRGKGLREPYSAQVHHVNPTCGDEVTLRVDVRDGVIRDISYDAVGCSISQASTSMMHELLVGKRLDQVWPVHEAFVTMIEGRGKVEPDEELVGDAVALSGVAAYPARVKCALLGWMAFKDAALQALGKDFT
jgi:nitrogen fixation NifU-like protein